MVFRCDLRVVFILQSTLLAKIFNSNIKLYCTSNALLKKLLYRFYLDQPYLYEQLLSQESHLCHFLLHNSNMIFHNLHQRQNFKNLPPSLHGTTRPSPGSRLRSFTSFAQRIATSITFTHRLWLWQFEYIKVWARAISPRVSLA